MGQIRPRDYHRPLEAAIRGPDTVPISVTNKKGPLVTGAPFYSSGLLYFSMGAPTMLPYSVHEPS
jgi:hypothetical protein